MALSDFHCTMRFRVPFHDMDMLKHVNHAAYIVWAETIRCFYFDDVLSQSVGGSKGAILAHLEFDYKQPLDYREEVAIGCRISRMGRKSFDMIYEIWSETRNLLAATGSSTLVVFNHESKSSIAIPAEWRETITTYELIPPEIA
jgi:acyl-CoA thioester hydrolase